jgi:GntR family transcriptional regulator, transcriptional repressor for pyruvate dehydrogenase complex
MSVSARQTVFAPLQVEGAVEAIVRRLGEAIGSGVLEPGERLPSEGDLAAQLAVAPMTLRQALAILRDAGFVETRRGRGGGSFVVEDARRALEPAAEAPRIADLRDLTDWRRAVSGEAGALAALRASAAQRELVRRAAAAVEGAATAFASFRIADARFHIVIAEASGNARLVRAEAAIQAELGEVLALVPGPELARRASGAGHEPLLRAIADADPPAARAATWRHVEATYDWILGLRLGLQA